jgi:predicted amidohydrolase YtcJ
VVVVSDDLFSMPSSEIKDARVVMTIVGGRVVYQAE